MTLHQSPFAKIELIDQTITQRIFTGLVDRLDEPVFIDGPTGESLNACDFIDRVKRLAGGLTAKQLAFGKTVALMAPNCPEFCVVFHAVAWAGGTITTLNPTYTSAEIEHQLKDSGADVLITVPDLLATAQKGAPHCPVIAMDSEEYQDLFGEALEEQVAVDIERHTVVLPYSSGTTGLPKGVMLSHRNLVVNVDQTLVAGDFRAGEVTAGFLPLFHIYGMTVLMNVHLAGGGCVVTMPRFDLEMFLKISQDHKARRMWVVPPVALALAKHPTVDDYDLSSIEQVFIAAAPSGVELSEAVSKRLDCVSIQGYGMTELSPVSHLVPWTRPRDGAAGVVVSNTACKIVDPETGNSVPEGEEGEVWIKGPQVMQGYLNNAKATEDTITTDGWLRTGDIAYVDKDGYLFIVDRLKELIKFKGFQIAPAELEATLIGMNGISDAAVIGIPDDEAGERPVAFIVRSEGGPMEDDIRKHFSQNLSTYKQLHKITFVDEIPKSASGKILRRLLRESSPR